VRQVGDFVESVTMPIVNRVWFADPTHSNVEAFIDSAKSEILGDYYSGPQIYSPSHNMPPTINFGSLVFEHDMISTSGGSELNIPI
jgi:hypothetical protein